MPLPAPHLAFAVTLSAALHALVLVLALPSVREPLRSADTARLEAPLIFVEAPPPPAAPAPPELLAPLAAAAPPHPPPPAALPASPPSLNDRAPAAMDAPAAPTAEEWAQAGRYTLKNSKRYRHAWGQHVRSLMGTAVEGPEQGIVRFRVEIAPDGTLVRLQTLWSTSAAVEARARQAIETLPALPPTPNGEPLVFERTVAFQAFDSSGPPLYKDDCLPDPPAFGNPFAWDGKTPWVQKPTRPPPPPDPGAVADCLRQLTPDSIEAESADDRRQLEQWGSGRLGR